MRLLVFAIAEFQIFKRIASQKFLYSSCTFMTFDHKNEHGRIASWNFYSFGVIQNANEFLQILALRKHFPDIDLSTFDEKNKFGLFATVQRLSGPMPLIAQYLVVRRYLTKRLRDNIHRGEGHQFVFCCCF